MECKNCKKQLRTDYSFCPDCGAKIIRNRITFKNLWFDFTERFFNIDNTFIRTFLTLFKKPEAVIDGYINGVRKKYLNPVSFLMLAIALGGFVAFLMQKGYLDLASVSRDFNESINGPNNPGAAFGEKFQKILLDYQSLFYFLMIPPISLISRLVFLKNKKYNLSEHFVLNLYGYSVISLIINSLYIIFSWNAKIVFVLSGIAMFLYPIYYCYMLKRVFDLTLKQILVKMLLFLAIFMVILIMFMLIGVIFLAIFTDTFQNLKNTSALIYTISSAKNCASYNLL